MNPTLQCLRAEESNRTLARFYGNDLVSDAGVHNATSIRCPRFKIRAGYLGWFLLTFSTTLGNNAV